MVSEWSVPPGPGGRQGDHPVPTGGVWRGEVRIGSEISSCQYHIAHLTVRYYAEGSEGKSIGALQMETHSTNGNCMDYTDGNNHVICCKKGNL